ncbi:MAG TPA: protein translocase subunit SecD [Acidimicrobiales bacterium]|nr:protein translocase subunit SecD [Acidimicrobiales bacterium]
MRSRPLLWSLCAMLLIAILSVGATILTGKTPLLGLDLKGGVSVVEQPQGKVSQTTLSQAQTIIENRVDGLGVSNSEVTVQGNDIDIELPGAKNDTQVLAVVGQTAQLFFRPVECEISPYVATPAKAATTTTTTAASKGKVTTTTAPGTAKVKAKTTTTTAKAKSSAAGAGLGNLDAELASATFPVAASSASPSSTPTSAPHTSTTVHTTSTTSHGTATTAAGTTTTTKTSTTATTAPSAAKTTTTTTPAEAATALATSICGLSSTAQESYMPPHGDAQGLTPADWDNSDETVVLPSYSDFTKGRYTPDYRYVLGPANMTGNIVKSATADVNTTNDEWEVDLSFTGAGSTAFNNFAAQYYECYKQDESDPPDAETCPPYGALQAIELDATVYSAPAIEDSSYPSGAVISANPSNPFTSQQATDLANALNYGSLPVRFQPQDIENVSPSIGTDSLKAGAVAGAVAVLIVILYLLVYYRALGLVVVIGICMSGAILYAITTLLSDTEGLALTLSGVIGLIVSVGVTADSCVVYFERLKEEIRSGRTVRTSVEKGFGRAFRTILAADFSSFIAALILYTLTVGDVRGFAFFLGLATLLNVVTTYFFTRPLVILIGRRAALGQGGVLGVSRGLGAGWYAQ